MTSAPPLPTDTRFEKLRAGQPLEFAAPPKDREEIPEEKAARTIPANWLKLLAADHKRIVSAPVVISNAIIEGPLDLEHASFECDLSVTESEFIGLVNFSFATFRRVARFNGSHFRGPASFRAAQANADFEMKGASFVDGASFQDLHVEEVLAAQGATFGAVSFERIKVAKSILFRTDAEGHRTKFGGDTRFLGAHIVGDANFTGSEFKAGAAFDSLRVDGVAFFRTDGQGQRTTFGGIARFHGAHIAGNAEFDGAEFIGNANFNRLQVDNDAFFRTDERGNQVTFGGEANFLNVHIAGSAEFDGAEFRNEAVFEGLKVGNYAFFRADKLNRPLTFHGPARFLFAVFGSGAQFKATSFKAIANFNNAHFQHAAQFESVGFAAEATATFIGARFDGGAYFDSVKFQGQTDFTASVADGDVRFSGAKLFGPISFREARFNSVFFSEPTSETTRAWRPPWSREPQPPKATSWNGKADFRGFTYERIYVYLPDLLPRLTPFDRQPYSQLETSLRKVGDEQHARKVYFERRRQERKNKFRNGRYNVWFLDWVYRVVANCGIAPLQLVAFALAFILLGAFLFEQPGALEPAKKDPSQPSVLCSQVRFAEALAVSVHYFLPMDVPVGDDCKPVSKGIPIQTAPGVRRFPYSLLPSPSWYATIFLRLAGAIFMGIGLAAVTGLLRRIAQ